jgi:hypothetical protein
MKRVVVLMLILALATVAAMPAGAGEVRHSGRVIAVDPAAGTLRVEEMKAWKGPDTGLVDLSLRVAPDSVIRQVSRPAAVDQARWPNVWEERPITLDVLKPGDFVTVTTTEQGNVAAIVELVRPDS